MWRDKPASFDLKTLLRGANRHEENPETSQKRRPTRLRTTLVALTADHGDRKLLTDLAAENGWDVHLTQSLEEAEFAVNRLHAPVALCDRELPEVDWRTVVRTLASSQHEPCVIVTGKRVDDYFWEEVIRNRGYDVLSKPLREYEVTRIVGLALSFWNSRTAGQRKFRR